MSVTKDLEQLPAAPVAAYEWLRRTEAEYRSAALTANLTHWLVQLSVSPDLVRLAMAVVDDELVHAELSYEVVRVANESLQPPQPLPVPRLERSTLAYPRRWEPLEIDVVAACCETFCLGETVAVPLFKKLRDEAQVPVAVTALDRILRDEVRHRDFGWLLLEVLLEGAHGERCRAFVAEQLGGMVERLVASYGAMAGNARMPDAIRRWGMMPGSEYAAALAVAAEREYRPRLSALGFDEATLACFDRPPFTSSRAPRA